MTTFPKLALASVADSRPCAPVPLNAMVKLGSEASLVTATLPVASPAAAGVKWASRLMLCPTESFKGVATLLMEKPLPLTLTREMVRLLVPVLLILTAFESLSPMTTSPKLALAGVADRRPCTPVPLNAMVKLGSEALLVTATLPVASPVAAGVKWASRLMLCPTESFKGVATLLMEKPLPLMLTREIVTIVVPEFVSVIVLAPLPATATFPKAKLSGLASSTGFAAALVRKLMVASRTATKKIRVNVLLLATGL